MSFYPLMQEGSLPHWRFISCHLESKRVRIFFYSLIKNNMTKWHILGWPALGPWSSLETPHIKIWPGRLFYLIELVSQSWQSVISTKLLSESGDACMFPKLASWFKQVLNKRHFYGNKRKITVKDWAHYKPVLEFRRHPVKKGFRCQSQASLDGLKTGSGNLLDFLGLKLECLWWSFWGAMQQPAQGLSKHELLWQFPWSLHQLTHIQFGRLQKNGHVSFSIISSQKDGKKL